LPAHWSTARAALAADFLKSADLGGEIAAYKPTSSFDLSKGRGFALHPE